MHDLVASNYRREDELGEARRKLLAKYTRRIGEHQLLQLTRGMENGKAPIALEQGPVSTWVPVPPHLSSSWATITGHMNDPPPRESTRQLKATGGRRPFPEKELASPDGTVKQVIWGGAHP